MPSNDNADLVPMLCTSYSGSYYCAPCPSRPLELAPLRTLLFRSAPAPLTECEAGVASRHCILPHRTRTRNAARDICLSPVPSLGTTTLSTLLLTLTELYRQTLSHLIRRNQPASAIHEQTQLSYSPSGVTLSTFSQYTVTSGLGPSTRNTGCCPTRFIASPHITACRPAPSSPTPTSKTATPTPTGSTRSPQTHIMRCSNSNNT